MSDYSSPEYLEAGGGSPLAPAPAEAPGRRGRRRGLLVGGGVAGLAVVGVGAWAAAQFFATGAQPAQALPSTTIGYASIDLDPSGGQKLEALRTLNKFPAFKDHVGLSTDDDIRQKIFESLDLPDSCKVFYDADIKPWLGERMAVAAVPVGGKAQPVVVLQQHDQQAADKALAEIHSCSVEPGTATGTPQGGWVFEGDWVVIAESEAVAQSVVDATGKGTLADDADFQRLTDAAGDPGIAAFYASPDAGQYAGQYAGKVASDAGGSFGPMLGFNGDTSTLSDSAGVDSALSGFKGAAVTVRFSGGALEVESAGSYGLDLSKILGTGRGGDVVETLPAAEAVAIGAGFDRGWLTQVVEQAASYAGQDTSADDIFKDLSKSSGLDLPADAEALFGDSAALTLGPDFNLEKVFDSSRPTDLPIALKGHGDDKAPAAVLTKILDQSPEEAAQYLGFDSDAGYFVIGPNEDFRTAALGDGGLGDTKIYRDAVPQSDKAGAVVFVNFDAGDDWLVGLVGDDQEAKDNLAPLQGLGIAAWQDGDLTHGVVRLTTD